MWQRIIKRLFVNICILISNSTHLSIERRQKIKDPPYSIDREIDILTQPLSVVTFDSISAEQLHARRLSFLRICRKYDFKTVFFNYN